MSEPTNPYSELFLVGRPRARGTLSALQVKLWRVLMVNMRRLKIGMREQDDAKIDPASIVVSQLANALHRVLSHTDLEARLDALEQQLGRKP